MMTQRILLIGLVACVWAAGHAADDPKGVSEEAAQSVLTKYGVSSTVLRPKRALRDAPPPGGQGFPIELEGKPGVRLVLDLDYWAMMIEGKGSAPVVYMLNPKDEQSALVITIGESKREFSDEDLAKEPGFTEIRRRPGSIGDEKVVWRSWSDAKHLYSDCTAQLSAVGSQDAKKYAVDLYVTANTPERRKALEEHLESLRLIFGSGPDEKAAEPNGGANGASPHRPP